MKKLYRLIITLMSMCMIACSNDDGIDKITLSQQTMEVGFDSDTYSINITSPYSWDAISKNDWIIVESPTGIAGTEQLVFSVTCNVEEKVRKGTIVIKNSDFNLITEFYIAQKIPNGKTKIYYTSTNGNVVTPYNSSAFGANIISNTYNNDIGAISFDGEVTTIGDGAFSGCSSLTSITIPDSVTTIGYAAFCNCSSLTSITIPDSVTTIGDLAFGYCSSLTSITIPDSVTTIGDLAFSGCSSLTEFSGKYASEDGRCLIIGGTLNSFAPAGLTEYIVPDSVTSIGDGAFSGCSSLTSVTIPNSVTSIGYAAFCDCSSLISVYCKATTPPAGGYHMFYNNATGRKIYVPMESVNAYKSAGYWNDYADAIVGYDF